MLLQKSYDIIDSIRLENGLYIASPSTHYTAVWIRDTLYISLPFLNQNNNIYEKTMHRMLDLLLDYEWKIDIHTKEKPVEPWQYIHAKYDVHNIKEVAEPWGHAQHDAIGMLLWAVGQGEMQGKKVLRNARDKGIIQKLVQYLETCEYWHDKDNGMWEEQREIHASSVGACVSGLRAVSYLVDVPQSLINKGLKTLDDLNGHEIYYRKEDLAQLSLIYPHRVYNREMALYVLESIEKRLLKRNGVIRYEGDSYYSTLEKDGRHHDPSYYFGTEGAWCMGLPWLAICHAELGNYEKAHEYLKRTEEIMLPDGSLPELYYAGTDIPNPNTPLGWANAMYVVAKERLK